MVHLLRLSSVKWFVSSSVSSFSRCNSLSCPTPHYSGSLSPGGKITRGILPPTRGIPPPPPPPPVHTLTPRKTLQTPYKFITLNYQNSTSFHYFFSFRFKFCQVSCDGGKLHRPGYLHPLGRGGKLSRVRGIPRGIFTPEGRHTAQRQLHSPCEEGEGQATQDSR